MIQIITQLARTFDTLGSSQRSQVAELVGGVYQINILKAVLGDLSKEYSTYSGALKASSGATNEAEARIGKLGETLDSQINRVTNNLKRAGSIVGELTIAPALEKVLSNVNGVLETFALGKEPEGYGEKAAVGFLKGLGSFISGPGLLLGATAAYQIFRRLATFVGDAGKTVLGLGQAAQQQAQIQAQILQVLQKNPQVYAQIESGAVSVQSAAQGYLNIVNATNAALERQKAIAAQMAGVVVGAGGSMPIPSSGGGRGKSRGRAAGYMPSISDQKKMEENDARALGAPSGVRAHFGKGTIGGKKFLMNSHEIEIPNYGANGDSAVIPKYAAGLNPRGGSKNRTTKEQNNVFSAGKVFDNAISIAAGLKQAYTEDYDILDYKPFEFKDPQVKEKLGLNNKTFWGDAKLSEKPINLDSYISKIIRSDNATIKSTRSGNWYVKPTVEGGSVILPQTANGKDRAVVHKTNKNKLMARNPSVENYLDRAGIGDKDEIYSNLFLDRTNVPLGDTFVASGSTRKQTAESLGQRFKSSSGYIPRFAAGDGSMSLENYMMMKYGEVKDTSKLGGSALNAAYQKGVSLDVLRGAAPKWANWTPGGATAAMLQGRQIAKGETQKNRAKKYGYRKIILPWGKSVSDFGGDANEFGDAYENLVAQKFGGKRPDRFKRANDYSGIAGRTPESKYNYTDVDFIVPKVAGDLSQGGSLIEARGGDKKNYNPSDITKKFDNFFKNNPSYDRKKWKKILVSRNAAGYIPRFAKGSKQKRRARYYRNNPRPLSLVPSGKEYTGEQTNTPSKPALKLAPRFTQQDLLQQRIDEAQAKSQAQKKAKFAYPTRILPPSISSSVVPAQPTQPARLTAEERLARAKASGKTLLSGGPGKAAKFDSGKAFMASMAISQGLGMAQSFGLINPESAAGQATTKGLEFLNLGLTAKGLYSEYAPSIGKKIASSGVGKRIAGSAIGRGVAGSMGRSAILGSMGGGFGAIAAPLAAAYGVGKIGQEAIDYFGIPGGFGTRDINKEQENAAKELAKYKTETGKSISGYVSAASSKYGLGNEDLGALRKGAIGNIANDLGGIQNVGRLLKESGGAGGGKGSADAFTKNVISSLQGLGKEVGDLADPKNFGKAKDLAAGLISEVKKFETLKSTTKTFNEVSTAMTTLTSKANMVLTVLRDLAQKESARGEALKKNFGGGVEGYLDPSKNAEDSIGIDRALRTLNDPRLARNQMARGRAANEFLTKTKELGIDIDPKVREQMSQIMAQGMRQFQGQNLGFLGRLGGSYRNDFGLRSGILRSDAAMNAVANKAGLTSQQYQLSDSQQAVEAGYLNPLQGKAMSLYGNRNAIQPFLDTERKIQQRKDDFDRLTQGRLKGTVPENVYNEVAQKMIDASKLQGNATDLVSQKDALRKMEDAFFGLDERLMAIAKFGEQFTQNATNVNINGGVKVDLSEDAKKYLNITESTVQFFTGKKDKDKAPPPQNFGGF